MVLNDKVAIVTGASSGIGRAAALAFGKAGAKIVVTARCQPKGKATVNLIKEVGGEALFVKTGDANVEQT